MKTIGVLGGMSWESTAHYYRVLNEAVRERAGGLHSAEILLHSLDFAFWYHKRPLWDIGVLFLMTGGLATSLLGLYFGLRRLKYDVAGLVSRLTRRKAAAELSNAA